MQAADVRKAHKRLALTYHPDKAAAACVLAGLAPEVTGPAVAAAAQRLRADTAAVFNLVQEAKVALDSDAKCDACRAALAREAALFAAAGACPPRRCLPRACSSSGPLHAPPMPCRRWKRAR